MMRTRLLSCVLAFGLIALGWVASAQEKDESQLPEGKDARDVAMQMQEQLLRSGLSGIERFEKQKLEYNKKFATDPGRWYLRLLEVTLLRATQEKFGGAGKTSKEILREINDGKDVPEEVKSDLSAFAVQDLSIKVNAGDAKFADLLTAAEQHLAHYPKARSNRGLAHLLVNVAASGKDAEQQLTSLGEHKNSDIAKVAEGKLKVIRVRKELTSKPLELSVKTVDGREVDFAKLRGKVVLVDFWATWCGPCMAEVPKVVSAYKKLKDKGFEIVGISLDNDVDSLKQVVADKEMNWLHYFDAQGELSEKYGVNAIPEMWLVDKKGMVKMYSRDKNLVEEVEKLLAE